jgi:hypothetical protein
VKQKGADAYLAKLDAAGGYFHWLADRARGRFDMKTSEGRVDAFKFLLPAIQRIGDKLERAAIANDVAGYLGSRTRGWCSSSSKGRLPIAGRRPSRRPRACRFPRLSASC